MGTRFGGGDLDLPATDEQYDDVGRFERDVGAEESLWRAFAVGISDQPPSDGQHRGAGPVLKGSIGGDLEYLPSNWPY